MQFLQVSEITIVINFQQHIAWLAIVLCSWRWRRERIAPEEKYLLLYQYKENVKISFAKDYN